MRCSEWFSSHALLPTIVRLSADELVRRRLASYAVIQVCREHVADFGAELHHASTVVLVADPEGWLLEWFGDEIHLAALAHLGIAPGCSLLEQRVGNLAVGTALHDLVHVTHDANDHFLYMMQRWSSAGSPIVSADNGQLFGVVGLMVAEPTLHPSASLFAQFLAFSAINLIMARESEERHRLLYQSLVEQSGTLQRNLEQQVVDAERQSAVTTLAAGIAHEIRNPLTTARGFLQLFQAKSQTERDREFLQLTIDEIDRVTRLLNDFMSLAKPDRAPREIVNLSIMAKTVGQLIGAEAALLGVRFTMQLENDLFIWGHANQIKQVVLNVLQNALQACAQNDQVTLTLSATQEDDILMSVHDTGSGMTTTQMERMFEPFYTTKADGTGMGMAVTRQILDEHGGTVSVQSTPDIGSTVSIFLRRWRADEADQA